MTRLYCSTVLISANNILLIDGHKLVNTWIKQS